MLSHTIQQIIWQTKRHSEVAADRSWIESCNPGPKRDPTRRFYRLQSGQECNSPRIPCMTGRTCKANHSLSYTGSLSIMPTICALVWIHINSESFGRIGSSKTSKILRAKIKCKSHSLIVSIHAPIVYGAPTLTLNPYLGLLRSAEVFP